MTRHRPFRRKHLDGDRAIDGRLPRGEHDPHAALAQLTLHFVICLGFGNLALVANDSGPDDNARAGFHGCGCRLERSRGRRIEADAALPELANLPFDVSAHTARVSCRRSMFPQGGRQSLATMRTVAGKDIAIAQDELGRMGS